MRYDVVVLGAGPAVQPAAIRAAQLGLSVAIDEANYWAGYVSTMDAFGLRPYCATPRSPTFCGSTPTRSASKPPPPCAPPFDPSPAGAGHIPP
jgi:hypothetical protein